MLTKAIGNLELVDDDDDFYHKKTRLNHNQFQKQVFKKFYSIFVFVLFVISLFCQSGKCLYILCKTTS